MELVLTVGVSVVCVMEVAGSWGGISRAMKRAEVVRCCDCIGEVGTKAIEGLTNKRAATVATENFIVNVVGVVVVEFL